jgi:MoaA/NifB/PqqE/SkfB family radical SAM enzyme
MNEALSKITVVKLFTGSYGRRGCTSKCPGCFMGTYDKLNKPKHQGTMGQVLELLTLVPNTKSIMLYGNPDVSVDPEFCNEILRHLQKNNITAVMFTSGIGGKQVIRTLMNGIRPEAFSLNISVDTINENKLSVLRGRNFSLSNIVDTMNCCNEIGLGFTISSNIWPINMNEDFVRYSEFFSSYGAKKVRFHFGSLEGTASNLRHVSEDDFLEIRNKMRTYGRVPAIMVTQDEFFKFCLETYVPQHIEAHKLHVFLEEDGIKATACCGILLQNDPEKYIVNIRNITPIQIDNTHQCPIAEYSLGFKCKKLIPVCRSFSCPKED